MSNWDVIFCRNVTIYFRLESTKRVVDNFYEALNPGGYLFIGHSETLTSVSERFEPVEINGVFLYRKPNERKGFTFADVVARRAKNKESSPKERKRRASAAEVLPVEAAEPIEAGERDALLERAHALLDQAQAKEALSIAERLLASDPSDLDGHLLAAFALCDTGDLKAATAQAEAALRVDPLAAPARYILGVIRQQQDDLAGALTEFKRTIYIDRDFVMAHFASANIHRQQGRMTDACRGYENSLRAMHAKPDGSWRAFLGGFRPDLLAKICERSLIECQKGASGAR
jgi:chemotaxis protein methyltransferase CheR